MRVKIVINELFEHDYVEIHTKEVNKEISEAVLQLQNNTKVIPVNEDGKIKVLKQTEIYLVKSSEGSLIVKTKDKTYTLNKKLYEVPLLMGPDFMKISKSTYINLKHLDSVEATFGGVMRVNLKNNDKDYISRMYVKELKKYLKI